MNGWVGVDLDGTLAVYDGWKGISHIGEPIPLMLDYVKDLLDAGIEVRIFTARVQEGILAIAAIKDWCLRHFGRILPVTDRKDFSMVYCIDDRAVAVKKNTGIFLNKPPAMRVVHDHWSKKNGDAPHDETV